MPDDVVPNPNPTPEAAPASEATQVFNRKGFEMLYGFGNVDRVTILSARASIHTHKSLVIPV